MDYIVCIPTYQRAAICKERTLKTLAENNIDPAKIYVYVIEEEYQLYKDTLDPTTYNEIRVGVKGLAHQRQFINEQWATGQPIVCLDDDVECVDLSISQFTTLDSFIKHAFAECVKHKAYIWGVYPVFNPFFRKSKKDMLTGLNLIVGAFYGIINRPTCKSIQNTISINTSNKEDVERSLKYFLTDGIILRFNKVGFKTKYYGRIGGLGSFKSRIEPAKKECEKLAAVYSEYGKIKTRKSGMAEFVLKKCLSTI